jgi:hypothetical protein
MPTSEQQEVSAPSWGDLPPLSFTEAALKQFGFLARNCAAPETTQSVKRMFCCLARSPCKFRCFFIYYNSLAESKRSLGNTVKKYTGVFSIQGLEIYLGLGIQHLDNMTLS